jgi:hypothetical protein
MFSARLYIQVGDRFEDQLKRKIQQRRSEKSHQDSLQTPPNRKTRIETRSGTTPPAAIDSIYRQVRQNNSKWTLTGTHLAAGYRRE